MAKSKAKTKVAKTKSVKKEVEEVKVTQPEIGVEEIKDELVVETLPPTPPADSKQNVITPEEVEEQIQEEEKDKVAPIGNQLASISNNERIDANHAVDLMGLIHKEYVSNSDEKNETKKAMKKQFDVMAMVSILHYNAQLENDFLSLGVKVSKNMFNQMEKVAREYLGITLKGLPMPEDPSQLMIDFKESEIPKDVKQTLKEEAKIVKEQPKIDSPDPNLREEVKIRNLKTILSTQGGGGIGANLVNGINWAQKAFRLATDDKPAMVLANMLNKKFDATLFNCLRGMVAGKLRKENSLLGAHALLKHWCPKYNDEEIAQLIEVLMSAAIEQRVYNPSNPQTMPKFDPDKEFELVNATIELGNSADVVREIINRSNSIILPSDKFAGGKITVETGQIRKSLEIAYGDSDSILKNKLNEITKFYKPIVRLSNYADRNIFLPA